MRVKLGVGCISGRKKDEPTKLLAQKYGAKYSLDWKDAIRNNDTETVMICTPPHTHLEISTLCMESGKHVLCEKPFSMTVKEGEEMLGTQQ